MKMTFRRIVIGGLIVFWFVVAMVVFMPALPLPDRLAMDMTQTTIAHPYTAEEHEGRVLFYSNGCNYCHTQYVREEDRRWGSLLRRATTPSTTP